MAGQKDEMKIAVGDVVRWGPYNQLGLVKAVRVIDTAESVKSFNGEGEKVILTVTYLNGTASVWAKKDPIEKVDAAATKNFLSQLGVDKVKR